MKSYFWKNWQFRKTSFNNKEWIMELTFFGNSFDHVERTTQAGAERLGVSGFNLSPCEGGGYEGKLVYNSDTFKESNK